MLITGQGIDQDGTPCAVKAACTVWSGGKGGKEALPIAIYAQIEEMRKPWLRDVPMAVGGSAEKRNGIILAKNDRAKAFGIKTGEVLHEARKKCPDLVLLHPDYEAYTFYTEKVKDIYRRYTDRVESFGLDEAWIDLTHSQLLFGDGIELARRIQKEVLEECGLTVSMGVSFNKVFAKMASDFFKHSGFMVIDEEHYQQLLWEHPIEDLFMVGRRLKHRLCAMGLYTIGDLARYRGPLLEKNFGKFGRMLWQYANGMDESEVHEVGYTRAPKSIGNSKTLVKDVTNFTQLFEVYEVLSESVAVRLRKQNLRGRVISLYLRSVDLSGRSYQQKLLYPTNLAKEIFDTLVQLTYRAHLEEINFRSIGVSVGDLSEESFEVEDLFSQSGSRKKQKDLEEVVQKIREQYGYRSCRYASSQVDPQIADFDPLSILHLIHPVGFLDGPIE